MSYGPTEKDFMVSNYHQWLDLRNLAMHRCALDRIRQDHSLIETIIRPTLKGWMSKCDASGIRCLKEWESIISLPFDELKTACLKTDERTTALRQSSPIPCVLSNRERFAIINLWRIPHGEKKPD